jgi:acyl-coenzyme A thioesterase PaaI-like protein
MSVQSVFVAQDGHFVATELARGPWDAGSQHGGAAAALLMGELERLPAAEGLILARVTYEFLRPVPVGHDLVVEASVVRPGRRVQLLEGSISAPDGLELVRARALQVRVADAPTAEPDDLALPPGPEQGRDNDFRPPYRPMFSPDAIEIRFVAGAFNGGGPATGWFRLKVPIVAGEEPSPLQRLAAAGDFGNGISAVLPWDRYVFINPDLTLYVERTPVGEWICLEAQTIITQDGVGTAESILFDERGRVGRATQALLVAPR